jgi:2-oxo-4-hydroxy-4-carboxy--5-ureidoimidazoline (OHCU) decarboxylase
VRDHDKASILDAFVKRLTNTREEEFATACRQVERIAYHRLKDLLP